MTTAIADPKPADPTPATVVPPVSDPPPAATPPADPAPVADSTPVVPPPADATPVTPPPADPARAVPEPDALVIPDGQSFFTAADLPALAAEATALGLDGAQTQAFVNARVDSVAAAAETWLAEAKADPGIGGAKFDETLKHALAGVAFMFPDASDRAFIDGLFNKSGAGNHKVLLAGFARIGRGRAEDTPPPSSATPAAKRTLADALYGDK